jgi:hypothetical protein
MKAAVPINRRWVIILNNGSVVVDWGDDVFQDIVSGEFLSSVDQSRSHALLDDECAWLLSIGCIQDYDNNQIYVAHLPERRKSSVD